MAVSICFVVGNLDGPKPRQTFQVLSGARVISSAEKRSSDRGGPVWPSRSNAKDDRAGPKKKHLIEAAPFGRLDQMLRTTVWGEVWGSFAPPAKTENFSKCTSICLVKNDRDFTI